MSRYHLLLCSGLLLLFSLTSQAQLANRPPVPEWISGTDLQHHFDTSSPLLMAVLLVASPDAPVTVLINQQALPALPASAKAASLDVTRLLRPGANSIALQSKGKVAVLLELNGDLAQKKWLTSSSSWTSARSHGLTDAIADANPFDLKTTPDAYNSWKLAGRESQQQATDPASLQVPPGYRIDLIHSATSDQDSWVAMAFDPAGRLTLGMEKKGLLRLSFSNPDQPEVANASRIDESLEECRGLLYAEGWLFANANRSKALVRLRDADDDGVFEQKQELLKTGGSYGHGRNHLKLGPDGRLWIAHGNNVLLPDAIAPTSPLQHYANDQLLPNPWDGSMFDGDVQLPAGHILSLNLDGSDVQLFAGGLRNPLDLAFNRKGQLFTFDADMERDLGTPWYMPTRVLHVAAGADFGWRRGTGRWPAYFADTLPSTLDVGLSSPTAVFFGYGAHFPTADQEALFICDWSYGRIIAVRLRPHGASYTAQQENFVTGRPLNVTDGAIGPDGALWFITGGRGTQSGLYRMTYHGEEKVTAQPSNFAPTTTAPTTTADLPARLAHADPFVRHAARMTAESLPLEKLRSLPLLPATALALVRVGTDQDRLRVLDHFSTEPMADPLTTLRIIEIAISRCATAPSAELKARLRAQLEPLFPSPDSPQLNHQLAKHLIYLRSKSVLPKSIALLEKATSSEDLLYYPFVLRYLKDDPAWNEQNYRTVFTALTRAEQLNGASTFFKAIADTRAELATHLPPALASRLASVISPPQPAALTAHALPGHSFKNWTLADLDPLLPQVAQGRSFESAKKALVSTQCVFCHRVAADNTLPAGVFGPDLTQVSARFGRRDLLDHILNPSKAIDEKFRFLTITRVDGSLVTGALESEDDERLSLRPNPLAKDTIEIGKSMIQTRAESPLSPMPVGLLNGLKPNEILDLLAWFEAQGNPKHPAFTAPQPKK